MKLSLLALASFFVLFSNAKAETVKDCSVLSQSLSAIDAKAIAKCQDIAAQQGLLFKGEGSGLDFGGCWGARGRSASQAINACRTFAVASGKDPRGCSEIANFQVSDGYKCVYRSLYYLKDSSSAWIGFTLDSETQMKLYREAQSRSMSVRDLIAEKLQK